MRWRRASRSGKLTIWFLDRNQVVEPITVYNGETITIQSMKGTPWMEMKYEDDRLVVLPLVQLSIMDERTAEDAVSWSKWARTQRAKL